jgi:hypothetical protein
MNDRFRSRSIVVFLGEDLDGWSQIQSGGIGGHTGETEVPGSSAVNVETLASAIVASLRF